MFRRGTLPGYGGRLRTRLERREGGGRFDHSWRSPKDDSRWETILRYYTSAISGYRRRLRTGLKRQMGDVSIAHSVSPEDVLGGRMVPCGTFLKWGTIGDTTPVCIFVSVCPSCLCLSVCLCLFLSACLSASASLSLFFSHLLIYIRTYSSKLHKNIFFTHTQESEHMEMGFASTPGYR